MRVLVQLICQDFPDTLILVLVKASFELIEQLSQHLSAILVLPYYVFHSLQVHFPLL